MKQSLSGRISIRFDLVIVSIFTKRIRMKPGEFRSGTHRNEDIGHLYGIMESYLYIHINPLIIMHIWRNSVNLPGNTTMPDTSTPTHVTSPPFSPFLNSCHDLYDISRDYSGTYAWVVEYTSDNLLKSRMYLAACV